MQNIDPSESDATVHLSSTASEGEEIRHAGTDLPLTMEAEEGGQMDESDGESDAEPCAQHNAESDVEPDSESDPESGDEFDAASGGEFDAATNQLLITTTTQQHSIGVSVTGLRTGPMVGNQYTSDGTPYSALKAIVELYSPQNSGKFLPNLASIQRDLTLNLYRNAITQILKTVF
jgi:hypothetical protein